MTRRCCSSKRTSARQVVGCHCDEPHRQRERARFVAIPLKLDPLPLRLHMPCAPSAAHQGQRSRNFLIYSTTVDSLLGRRSDIQRRGGQRSGERDDEEENRRRVAHAIKWVAPALTSRKVPSGRLSGCRRCLHHDTWHGAAHVRYVVVEAMTHPRITDWVHSSTGPDRPRTWSAHPVSEMDQFA